MNHQKLQRYTLAGVALVGIMLVAGPLFAQGVVGSRHDLSPTGSGSWGATDEDQVCVFCHTPHGAVDRPLWNRNNPTAVYNLYTSATMDSTVGQPTGSTLLCLSCHDGVTALNDLVNPSRNTDPNNPAMDPLGDQLGDTYFPGMFGYAAVNIGGSYPGNPNVNDLSDDHPVSFVMDAAVVAADGNLQLPPVGDAVRLVGLGGDRLECTSCHDPHDQTIVPFLVKSNDASDLCMTCHLK